jgi:hypothetical protein
LLILRHFNERLAEKYRLPLYSLAYETRPALDGFLNEPTEQAANDNVDFFHLYHAVRAIEQWFGARATEVEDIKSALLNNTKVIWYQLADRDKPVEAFTRLNVGKSPLTNDELIRALFLRQAGPNGDESESVQLRIAHEWDLLEKSLQSNAFWYFNLASAKSDTIFSCPASRARSAADSLPRPPSRYAWAPAPKSAWTTSKCPCLAA